MLKFGGFKASLNVFNGKKTNREYDVLDQGLCLNGAYRTNRDEYFGNDRVLEPPKRLTPSMVKLPEPQAPAPAIRPTQSTNDLTKPNNLPAHLRYSTPTVSLDPRGEENKEPRTSRNGHQSTVVTAKQEKEQAKVKKKQLAEQKARDKLAAQERAKQEKLAKAREKKEAKQKADKSKKDKKVRAPAPPPLPTNPAAPMTGRPSANPLAQGAQTSNYPTNTLESSISRSSGPPPYSEVPNPVPSSVPNSTPSPAPIPELIQNGNDPTGNVTFSKPIDTGSWDMVSKHRQQVSKTTLLKEIQSKQKVMDLNYSLNNNRDNSEA